MDGDGTAARSFSSPPLVRTLALWGAVSSAAAAACVVALRLKGWWQSDVLTLLGLGFCAASLYWSVLMLRSARDTFVAGPEGLWHHPGGRPSAFLPWDEVGDVYPENVMQRLVVADRSGKRLLAIEFHLQDFGDLRRIILDKVRSRS